MAKPARRFRKLLQRVLRCSKIETACGAYSKANGNSLWGLRRYHGQGSGMPAKAAAGGFEFLRPSKAAAGLLRVLRLAQNVPRSSFKAQ